MIGPRTAGAALRRLTRGGKVIIQRGFRHVAAPPRARFRIFLALASIDA